MMAMSFSPPELNASNADAVFALLKIISDPIESRSRIDGLVQALEAVKAEQAKLSELTAQAAALEKARADFEASIGTEKAAVAESQGLLERQRARLGKDREAYAADVEALNAARAQLEQAQQEVAAQRASIENVKKALAA